MNHKFKLPLAYSSHRQIIDADINVVIEVWSGGQGIDAADELQAFIVTACNAHDTLTAALNKIILNDPYKQSSAGVIARAAIAAVGGATPAEESE